MADINIWPPVISFFGGFILAVISDPIKNLLRQAHLSVHFQAPDDMVFTPDNKHKRSLYTKVKIRNKSLFNTARKVRCYLVEIERKAYPGQGWEQIFDVPLALAWAYLDYEPLDIPPPVCGCILILRIVTKARIGFCQLLKQNHCCGQNSWTPRGATELLFT